ncbi:hypothetical protein D9M70_541950 [compost metagenome]
MIGRPVSRRAIADHARLRARSGQQVAKGAIRGLAVDHQDILVLTDLCDRSEVLERIVANTRVEMGADGQHPDVGKPDRIAVCRRVRETPQ